ncbi:hypothetical protein BGZ65_009310 [Modicella reniformis]|uniref:Uncharacterized protein n=1 Tax=Modicella reniformis TaxID=1440133 RepID=A0A9P6IN13_9FUNG|nr:hypothetical protein BGZ65_009310 [Modicella reniformis]
MWTRTMVQKCTSEFLALAVAPKVPKDPDQHQGLPEGMTLVKISVAEVSTKWKIKPVALAERRIKLYQDISRSNKQPAVEILKNEYNVVVSFGSDLDNIWKEVVQTDFDLMWEAAKIDADRGDE